MLRFIKCCSQGFSPVTSAVRLQSSYSKFLEWYRELWVPKQRTPPYKHVCQIGDPTLRLKAQEVNLDEMNTKPLKDILIMLRSVMMHYKAVGISAPQIGVPLRIIMIEIPNFVVEHFGPEVCKTREIQTTPFKVFINPTIEVKDFKKVVFPEACESLRGLSALVPRYKSVQVKGYDYDGSPTEWEAVGWAARIVQHEIDHLNGKIYTDIMDCKTLQNDHWKTINQRGGDYRVPYK